MAELELGIAEVKDVLVAILDVAEVMAKCFKDGVQAQDATVVIAKIMESDDIKAALMKAYNEIDKVKAEVKTLSFSEMIELGIFTVPKIVSIVGAIKK